ncbi:hypothetical protein SDC9_71659 [bioreactor metagenome]|uniref:Uncharacterized protein n=1 Tax=bioreactor metagenome TaxID=1076179 RepID=A0A644YA28_9ZZZZ
MSSLFSRPKSSVLSISLYWLILFLFMSFLKPNFWHFLSERLMFSSIVRDGDTPAEGFWCTLPMNFALSFSLRRFMFSPFNIMSPSSCIIAPLIMLNNVLFPQPFAPRIPVHSPLFIWKSKLVNMFVSLSVPMLKLFDMFFISSIVLPPLISYFLFPVQMYCSLKTKSLLLHLLPSDP